MSNEVDIKENDIYAISPQLLHRLLKDHTMSKPGEQVNIFWATDNYSSLGKGFQYNDQIRCESITGIHGEVIKPRAQKCREQQQQRSRDMAEVFTPSWICNKQNNLVDNAWFGRDDVFNHEIDRPDGSHSWEVTLGPITFPEGMSWMDYVRDTRLEITCGEAPYLVSRYDSVTGEPIEVERRIGLLDRKLRIINENTAKSSEWLSAARIAYQNTYGYEWQGDNLVLAREALLFTLIDHYKARFKRRPTLECLTEFADIISWNIWQMDGLKCVIPGSCVQTPKAEQKRPQMELFNDEDFTEREPREHSIFECPGCAKKGLLGLFSHTGIYAKIMDWEINTPIEFISLFKNN